MSTPTPHDYETVEEIAGEFMQAIDSNASDYGKAAQILRDYVDAENAKLREVINEVLAAWDKRTGLLISHYPQAGHKLIERLREAVKPE